MGKEWETRLGMFQSINESRRLKTARNFLIGVLALAGVKMLVDVDNQNHPEPYLLLARQTDAANFDPSASEEQIEINQVKLFVDKKTQLPTRYIVGEREIRIDTKKAKAEQNKAIVSNQPQLLDMTGVAETYQFKASKENPTISKLPSDCLTSDQLEQKGINIIQGTKTNFYIRKNALADGSPLSEYTDQGKKVTFVVLDAPYVDQRFALDGRYSKVFSLLPHLDQDQIREASVKLLQIMIDKERNLLKFNRKMGDSLDIPWDEQVLLCDLAELRFANNCSKEDTSYLNPIVLLGLKCDTKDGAVIFICTGGKPPVEFSIVGFNSSGEVTALRDEISNPDLSPRPEFSVLNPETFKKKTDQYGNESSSYQYIVDSPCFTVEHEIEHLVLPEKLGATQDQSDEIEKQADLGAYSRIESGFSKWKKSGCKDNSLFPFCFSITPELGGGYIIGQLEEFPNLENV